MAKLVAEEGVLKGLVFDLEDRDEWVLGRDPDLSTLILEDPKTSRQHLIIRKRGEDFFLESLSMTNPVVINGKKAEAEVLLKAGDRITIGGTKWRFYLQKQELEESAFKEEKETIFEEESAFEALPPVIDLSTSSRFILKVIGGPNTGAEYILEPEKEYLIGSDATLCDIVFHDLSVSREHAKLFLDNEGRIFIEDLESRNGVLVDREKISGKRAILPQSAVTLGTSAFLVIDREAPSMTILSTPPSDIKEEIKEEVVAVKAPSSPLLSSSTLLLALILGGLLILLIIGALTLFKEKPIETTVRNPSEEIQNVVKGFPCVQFNYNEAQSNLMLFGHVSNTSEKNALIHNLQGLGCFRSVEDNIIVDDAIWQEMNQLLAKNPEFEGVSMHTKECGKFVLSGYLKTAKQRALLTDFIHLNFLYTNNLENRVIVEEEVSEDVKGRLFQKGFYAVALEFVNGQLTLTGYANAEMCEGFQKVVEDLSHIRGVRLVRNYVVFLSPEQAVVDLNEKFPGRYNITGYSKCGNVNINVVINGKMLMRGDALDGMTITCIQPHTIFFEKDGLKYKLEYNK